MTDGCPERNILARAMVKLDGEYDLQIEPRSRVGGGLMSVAGLVKGMQPGQTEHTRGRMIMASNKYLCRHVLEEAGVQTGLSTWKKVYLKLRPAPRGEGWHVVEIADIGFEGKRMSGSHWICPAMEQDTTRLTQAEKEQLLREGSAHYDHYCLYRDIPVEQIVLQPGETDGVRWADFAQIHELIRQKKICNIIAKQFLRMENELHRRQNAQ